MAKKHVTVVLAGDGGDEVFGGYSRYCRTKRDAFLDNFQLLTYPTSFVLEKFSKVYSNSNIDRIKKFLIKSHKSFSDREVSYNCFFTNEQKEFLYSTYFKNLTWSTDSYQITRNFFDISDTPDIRDNIFYFDLVSYFPDFLMTKMDIATMASSLEARFPFIDHHLIELSGKIPFNLKVKGLNQTKYILKKALEKYIPNEILYRQKVGFNIPLGDWFKGKLNEYAQEQLKDKGIFSTIFNYDYIEELLNESKKGNDFGMQIWSLLTLKLWFKHYFN